mgnify:CR=1 FL=1
MKVINKFLIPSLLFVFSVSTWASEDQTAKFSMLNNEEGQIVKLNVITGEACIVGKSCDVDIASLKIGEHYIYLGNGKFEHQEVVKWEDLKK